MRSFLTVAICAIGVFGAPDTRVTDPPQSPYVLDTNGIPWRRLHLASNLRNNAQDWGGRNKQEHFLEEVRDVYSAIMENRLDIPFETRRTKATVSFAKHNTVNSTQTIYRYNVAIGPEQHPWVGRRMVLDTSFMVLRYFKFTRLTSPSTTGGPDTCAATGDVCSDALYPALNKTCCEGSCERYPGSNRTNICVHGARPSSAATRACGAMLGEVCDDTMFPQSYPRTCCEGTCTPLSARSSVCMHGQPVPMGELCYLGDLETYVNGGFCAPGSYCMSVADPTVMDRFCGHYNIDIGEACGTTVAEGFHGYCKYGLDCTDGICQTACLAAGETCWFPLNGGPPGRPDGRECCSGQWDAATKICAPGFNCKSVCL